MKNYQFLQQKFILNTYPNRGITLVKGNGLYLYDQSGKMYLDMMSNYGVNIFGYNNPYITNALTNQLKTLSNLHGSFNTEKRSLAAQELINRCGNFSQLYFSNSGAEAIEAALKFVVVATGKKKIIAVEHSYHGKTLGALSVTYGEKYRKPFEPFGLDVVFVPYNSVSAVKKVLDNRTAAFILEPVQGEGGLQSPAKGYLEQIKKICHEHDVPVVFDEIQAGTGRTGKFLASQWENVEPDILCLGKGIAGGIPVGVTVVNESIAQKIPRNIHTSTFGGNPLTCTGIISTLKLLDENRLRHIRTVGEYFKKQLHNLQSVDIGEIRGKGLMIGLQILNEKRNTVLKLLQQNNILAIPAGEDIVRFLPPYIIEKKHVDIVVKMLDKIIITI